MYDHKIVYVYVPVSVTVFTMVKPVPGVMELTNAGNAAIAAPVRFRVITLFDFTFVLDTVTVVVPFAVTVPRVKDGNSFVPV